MFIAKIGAGVLGVGVCCVGGIAITKPEWLGLVDRMPGYHNLSEDNDYVTKKESDYKDKFGSKYSRYLVGANNKKDSDTQNNQKWWEWSYRRWEKDKNSENNKPGKKFENVKRYGTTREENTAINKICDAAYKDEASKINSTDGDDNYKESDVWKYCSPLGNKPIFVQAAQEKEEGSKDSDSGKIGNSKKAELVSTTDSRNDIFWEIRNKEFKNGTSPFNIADSDNNHKYFKAKKGKENIRDICRGAYGKNENSGNSSESSPKTDEVTKFCGFKEEGTN